MTWEQLEAIPWLSILLAMPLAGALWIGFFTKTEWQTKRVALAFSVLTFLVSLPLWAFNPGLLVGANGTVNPQYQFQFVERFDWLPDFGVSYHLGVDGIAVLLILLTTFLQIFAVWISFDAIHERFKEYFIFLLILETGMLGVFCALDLIVFYIFWEAMLIPMYFLIGIWGGKRRIYAAIKFFLYTMAGSMLMLVAILALYLRTGSFDLLAIKNALIAMPLDPNIALLMFSAFALAFAIKVPMFPFHTWLPDAHVEAPTAGSVILAGVMLKLGTFGFIRYCIPLFPEAARAAAPLIIALAVIGIVYGAFVAAMQRDVKKLVAYSSVSHLGFVMLGLFAFTPQALSGAVLQMINHGISTGALFLLVGMIYERRHTRQIRDFGGLWEQMPLFGRIFLIVTLSSIALPLTNGFVGEFLILLGSFQTYPWAVGIATTGVIWSAVYMLWMFQRVMYGPVDKPANRALRDLTRREQAILVPFVICIFWFGIYPATFTRKMDSSLDLVLREATGAERFSYPQSAALTLVAPSPPSLRATPSPNAGRGGAEEGATSAGRSQRVGAAEAVKAFGSPLPALGEGVARSDGGEGATRVRAAERQGP